jgi:hypothetical protein
MTNEPAPMFMAFTPERGTRANPGLIIGTPSKRKAINAARKVGGTVERWVNGEAPSVVDF